MKIINSTLYSLIIYSVFSFQAVAGQYSGGQVRASGETGHYNSDKKLAVSIAKEKAKGAARKMCSSKSLDYGSIDFDEPQYKGTYNSSGKHWAVISVKAKCK